MTLDRIDLSTGEVLDVMTEADARRITERIRLTASNAREALEKLPRLIEEARAGSAHVTLGYASWTAYLAAVLGEEPLRLPRDQRQEIVGYLAGEGLSTRAIASVVGVSVGQTHADRVAAGVQQLNTSQPERIDRETGEVLPRTPTTELEAPSTPTEVLSAGRVGAATPPAPRSVVGLDGKTYTRPEPKETPKETTMTAASRLAIPQPPKYGGNRPKHNQVIGNVIVSAQGLCIVADEIQALDGSINNEEAASYASDLSRIIRSLKRVQQLLTKEV